MLAASTAREALLPACCLARRVESWGSGGMLSPLRAAFGPRRASARRYRGGTSSRPRTRERLVKKGRHRRFEEARSMKRAVEVTLEPCPECGADPEDDHAAGDRTTRTSSKTKRSQRTPARRCERPSAPGKPALDLSEQLVLRAPSPSTRPHASRLGASVPHRRMRQRRAIDSSSIEIPLDLRVVLLPHQARQLRLEALVDRRRRAVGLGGVDAPPMELLACRAPVAPVPLRDRRGDPALVVDEVLAYAPGPANRPRAATRGGRRRASSPRGGKAHPRSTPRTRGGSRRCRRRRRARS